MGIIFKLTQGVLFLVSLPQSKTCTSPLELCVAFYTTLSKTEGLERLGFFPLFLISQHRGTWQSEAGGWNGGGTQGSESVASESDSGNGPCVSLTAFKISHPTSFVIKINGCSFWGEGTGSGQPSASVPRVLESQDAPPYQCHMQLLK